MKLDFLEKRLSLAQRRPLIANLYPLPPGRGGALLEIHGRGVMPGSPTPNSVRPKTVIFHTRFQPGLKDPNPRSAPGGDQITQHTCLYRQKLCYRSRD